MVIGFFLAIMVLLLLGFPVAFTLGGVSLAFGMFVPGFGMSDMPHRIFGVMNNGVLIAVPLFVYMGVMLERSGIAEDLLETMAMLFGRVRGGLALSVIIVGALLAASTGIVGATVVTMGLMSLPTMLKRGYSAEVATGTIAASGTLGQIIPPSIVLILLATTLSNNLPNRAVGIDDMFLGALVPGMILVALYLAWIGVLAVARPGSVPAMPVAERAAFRAGGLAGPLLRALAPPLLLIVAVLGSILKGIATPTEAAAVGALGATVLTLLHRRLSLDTLRHVMRETTHLTSMVFVILVGATAFSLVFRYIDGDAWLRHQVMATGMSDRQFLLLIMLVIFFAGFFIDFIEIIFIMIPVIAPILPGTINPLWLGVLIAMNLQTSFLTPPFGFSLFYLKGVAPKSVTTGQIYRGILPYICIQLIGLGIVYALPDTVLWVETMRADQLKARQAAVAAEAAAAAGAGAAETWPEAAAPGSAK